VEEVDISEVPFFAEEVGIADEPGIEQVGVVGTEDEGFGDDFVRF